MRAEHEKNRLSWNAATVAHNSHKGDQARFFREGGDTLFPEEIELLRDLRGKRLVHLQCNAGQDTLSLARRGASVTGVDISDDAISFATSLARDSGIPATFERADVYDWLATARDRAAEFDLAFCSYGALCWLSDIRAWAAGVAAILAPGGRLVIVEFHPLLNLFDDHLERKYSYFGGEPLEWADGVRDYVAASEDGLARNGYQTGAADFRNPHACYEFQWTIGDRISAVLSAGLRIEHFREYSYSNGCKFFDGQVRDEHNRWHVPPGAPTIPQMYSLAAAKGVNDSAGGAAVLPGSRQRPNPTR
jgi:SAM-dependent methyltransferase